MSRFKLSMAALLASVPLAVAVGHADYEPRRRGARRFLTFLLLALVFTAAVAIAVIIATSTSSTVVQFRQVVAHDAQSAINSVKDLIHQYTK
jgi:hypothetical protein